MEKYVKELLTEKLLSEIAVLYGISKEKLYFVGGFENIIYGFDKNNESYILRITHSSHRTLSEVKSEIDFIHYLAKNNANVSTPINTVNNNLVEKLACSDGSYFIISAFTKAEGEVPSKQNATDKMFYNYGKTIGSFHRLTKTYKVSKGINKRYTWDQDLIITNANKYLSKEDSVILERLNEVVNEINTIPRNKDNFGLIHTDIHMGNFLVIDDKLSVFDFDDSAYQYFISDIAIALFYLVFMQKEEDQIPLANRLMPHFMQGYLSENKLSKVDYLKIPLFLKLRLIILYIVIFRTLDVTENKFANFYINRYRDRIINNIPFVNLEFEKYYK